MAERRMFSRKIVESDKFLDMEQDAQLLYFHLCMYADDDGFIDNPKTLMRCIGVKDTTMTELIDNGYIIPFPSGIVVVAHWKLQNYIAKDRYRPTIHLLEKEMIESDDANAYLMLPTPN